MLTCFGDLGTESSGYTPITMSKSSSSDSNTTISTSPAEALPLEGLEYIDINRFVGIAKMRKAIDLQSIRLQEGVSNEQYLVFQPVTEVDLTKMDSVRHSIGKNTRMTHYTDTDLLIIKLMPTGKHEFAHLSFGKKLLVKVLRMGTSDDELCPFGGTRYRGNTSSKEGDSSYKPSSRENETDWPTIVFESGLSESLRRLRSDARWWLKNSGGDVKIVVLISIKPADKRLQIEKWELAPLLNQRATRAHQSPNTQIPAQIQEITIMPNNVITGSPLVLEFQKIFLRPSVLLESDIIFTAADLSGWADAFWRVVK
jgi:hypothetical protein